MVGIAIYVAYCCLQVAIVAPDSLTWTFDRPWSYFWSRDLSIRTLAVLSCVGATLNIAMFAGFVYLLDSLCRAPTDAAAMRLAEEHPETAQVARLQWQLWQLFVFTTASAVCFALFRDVMSQSHEESADYLPLPVAYLRFHIIVAVMAIGLTITVLAIDAKSRWRAPRRAWQPGEWLLLTGGVWVVNAVVFQLFLSTDGSVVVNYEAYQFVEVTTRMATMILYIVAAVRVGQWSAWRLFFALEGAWELLNVASTWIGPEFGMLSMMYMLESIVHLAVFVLGMLLLLIAVLRERRWWKWRNGFHKLGVMIFVVFALLHNVFQIAALARNFR